MLKYYYKWVLSLMFVVLFIFSSISSAKNFVKNDNIVEVTDACVNNLATGFVYVKEIDGTWWFINETGKRFYSIGCSSVNPNELYYGNLEKWVNSTKKNLDTWGFNTIFWSQYELFSDLYYVHIFKFKTISGDKGWIHKRIPDVFDPDWKLTVREQVFNISEKIRDDPYLIGYQTDNEMKWGPDYSPDDNQSTLLEVFMEAPATTPGKQRVISFFKERYENVDDFNLVWNMDINSFDDLEEYHKFGFEGWRIRSKLIIDRLMLFNEYSKLLIQPRLLKKAELDITNFSELVAWTYFNITDTALNDADPNHLNLGVRFHLLGVPEEVLKACAAHVDVISINYYRQCLRFYDPEDLYYQYKYDCVPLDQWMKRYYEKTDKPIIASEFNFQMIDNFGEYFVKDYSPTRKIRTQKQRGDLYTWYVENCFEKPYIVGQFFFVYRDRLTVNMGLVNIWEEPYETFINEVQEINNKVVETYGEPFNKSERSIDQQLTKPMVFSSFVVNELNMKKFFNMRKQTDDFCFFKNYDYKTQFNIQNDYDVYVDDDSICPGNGSKKWPYCKIQYAMDNSSENDTIYVYNGFYEEKIIIDKTLNLVGENREKTVIKGEYEEGLNDIIIMVNADNVTISNFNITSFGGYIHNMKFTRECSGIYINNYSNCSIFNNNFFDLGHYAIKVLRGKKTIITGNVIYKTLNKHGCNIFLDSSNNSVINNNSMFNGMICEFWLSRSSNCCIEHNVIVGGTQGIVMQRTNLNIILNNTIYNNGQKGIFLKDANNNAINNNNFMDNYKSVDFWVSYNNTWNHNYWDRSRKLPKLIWGRTGFEGLIPVVNIDWEPALDMN